jgi:predicted aconitase with swiveling domain
MSFKLRGRGVTKGKAEGEAIVSNTTFSFLGGLNPETGVISESGHEFEGESVAKKVFVFPRGKGSTYGPFVLVEASKNNVAPIAIINLEAESIVATAAILAGIPLVDRLERNPLEAIRTGDLVKVDADEGVVEITRKEKDC